MAPMLRERSHIIVAGGGAAGLEAVIALRALLSAEPAITLVAPEEEFIYQPLTVRTPFSQAPAPRLALRDFARDLDAVHCRDRLEAVAAGHSIELGSGATLPYDKLVVAVGAPRVPVYPHATSFRGDEDVQAVRALRDEVIAGTVHRIAFLVPTGVAWSLPLYELALLMARLTDAPLELTLVTPEDRPLGVFGAQASAELRERLSVAGIDIRCRTTAAVPTPNTVVCQPGDDAIEVDRVVALPVVRGPRLWGLPADPDGFIPIDRFARVSGATDVYAAGDAANFPLKQGGLACQQADAAAEHIAYSLGALGEPEPFRPVLRGQLLTGDGAQFMRHDVTARHESGDETSSRPLWWPATKIAGKYLAAYLADHDDSAHSTATPGVRRRAILAPSSDSGSELPLRGYEYGGRWSAEPDAP